MKKFVCISFAALALSSCAQRDGGVCNGLAPRVFQAGSDWKTQRPVALGCVDHWAARLSRGNAPVSEVADAAVGACWETIELLDTMKPDDGSAQTEEVGNLGFWQRQAIFRVVQWRAGHCGDPDK